MAQCEACGVFVKDENLWKHYKKVHPTRPLPILEQKPIREPKRVKQPRQPMSRAAKAMGLGVLILVVAIGIGVYYASPQADLGDCISGHTGIAYHWHTTLLIYEDGNLVTIPADVGIEPGCMSPIHTHAEDNKIHIEPNDPNARYSVKDFFDVWGRPFELPEKMWVDGAQKTVVSDVLLLDGRVIELYY